MTPADLERVTELQQEVDKIEETIEDLYGHKYELEKEIRVIRDKDYIITNELLGLKNGLCVVAVNKYCDYHYTMVELFKCVTVSKQDVHCVYSKYREDDGEYSFHSVKENVSIRKFHSLLDHYDLYAVTEYSYEQLMYSLWRVDITYENRDQFIEKLKSVALTTILSKE